MSDLEVKVFAKNDVNCKRQDELDLARAVIIFCLPLIHCIIECTDAARLAHGIPYLFDTIIGGPFSAPMYMFIMGVGMAYTKKSSPKQHIKRGIYICVTGYILNVCRFLVPYLIGYIVTGEYDKYINPLLYKFLGNDILIFAGLSMIIIALMLKAKISAAGMLLSGMGMSLAGTVLTGIDAKFPLLNIFLGYLIGTEDEYGKVMSYFPLLNWMLFPICGYIFGRILKRVKNKDIFYLIIMLPSIVVTTVYFFAGIHYSLGMFGDGQNRFYHLTFCEACACLILTLGRIGVCHFICRKMPQNLLKIFRNISRNVTAVYCIHWVLISVLVNVLLYAVNGTQRLEPVISIMLGSAISVVSIIAAHYFRLRRECVNIEKAS